MLAVGLFFFSMVAVVTFIIGYFFKAIEGLLSGFLMNLDNAGVVLGGSLSLLSILPGAYIIIACAYYAFVNKALYLLIIGLIGGGLLIAAGVYLIGVFFSASIVAILGIVGAVVAVISAVFGRLGEILETVTARSLAQIDRMTEE